MGESGIAPAGTLAALEVEAAAELETQPPAAPRTRSADALAAFYNAPHRRRARANTAKSVIGTGERPQEIYTPPEIRDAILRVWPHVEYDPCSGPDSIIDARRKSFIPVRYVETGKFNDDGSPKMKAVYVADPSKGEENGLDTEWPDYTYSNPPFALLEHWMPKAAREALEGNPHREIMQIVPVRSQRKWWRRIAASTDRICWLDSVRFIGYPSGFPQACAMLYWGDLPATFEYAFSNLGDVREF